MFRSCTNSTRISSISSIITSIDCAVTIANSDDETPQTIGKHIASKFTEFTEECSLFTRKQTYVFRRDASEEDAAPLSRYLMNDDITQIFTELLGNNDKEQVLQSDSLLEKFYGDAEVAKNILAYEHFTGSASN